MNRLELLKQIKNTLSWKRQMQTDIHGIAWMRINGFLIFRDSTSAIHPLHRSNDYIRLNRNNREISGLCRTM